MNTTTRGAYWLAKSPEEKLLQQTVLAKLFEHGLRGWTVIFSRESGRLGFCDHSRKEICISRKVILSDWSEALDTAMHEVAHALTPGHGHDSAWKSVAKSLGAKPRSSASNYANTHQHGQRKTVQTDFGPVELTIGEVVKIYGALPTRPALRELQLVELKQKSCIGKDEKGRLYDVPLSFFHPNFGDLSKIIQRRVTLKSDAGLPVAVTIGKSYYIQNGIRYIAVEPKQKKVIAMASNGHRLRIPAEFLRED